MRNEPKIIPFSDYFKVGEGATICGYSDRHAGTVIAMTAKSVTIRMDKATLLNGMNSDAPDKLVCHRGGFCGHVEGTQRYKYEPDPEGRVVIGRLVKGKIETRRPSGRLIPASGGAMPYEEWEDVELPLVKTKDGDHVVPGRSEHYDYNF
jgi:hypothetical protein